MHKIPDAKQLAELNWLPNPPGRLSVKQRSYLKSLAHHLKPVIRVGQEGVNPSIVGEIRKQLLAHELIKVKWSSLSKEEGNKKEQAEQLAARIGAHYVHLIGQTVLLYREPESDYLPPQKARRIHLPQSA
jgi:RNA-binding protein